MKEEQVRELYKVLDAIAVLEQFSAKEFGLCDASDDDGQLFWHSVVAVLNDIKDELRERN